MTPVLALVATNKIKLAVRVPNHATTSQRLSSVLILVVVIIIIVYALFVDCGCS